MTTPVLNMKDSHLCGSPTSPTASWPSSLPAALRAAARRATRGITYVRAGRADEFQSYRELLGEAERVRALLRSRGCVPGDPVLLQVRDNRAFLIAFWGSIIGGYVPTPVAPPAGDDDSSATFRKVQAARSLLRDPVVVTDDDVRDAPASEMCSHWLPAADSVALNLLTSGSTGRPKCVQLSHRAVSHRSWAAAQHSSLTDSDVSLNWMPLDHVGGIVMWCVEAIFLGCSYVQVDTDVVIARPRAWLDLVDRFRASITWAPNFAFALVCDDVTGDPESVGEWDFGCVRHVLDGGEAVVSDVAQRFARILHRNGSAPDVLHPSWGMSETCSGVVYSAVSAVDDTVGVTIVAADSLGGSVRAATAGERTVSLTVTGRPIAGVSVRVVDDSGEVQPHGRTGNLEITGATIMNGYFDNPEAQGSAFSADGWFRTGDVAFVDDGVLTITGRRDDVVVVNGINFPNYEIEAHVSRVAGIRPSSTAVCTGHDGIVVFTVARADGEIESITVGVKKAVARDFGVVPDVVVLPPERFVTTGSGKIARTALLADFESGAFDEFRFGPAASTSRFFSPTWVTKTGDPVDGDLPHRRLVFSDDPARWDLSRDTLVMRGRDFGRRDSSTFVIDPAESGHFDQLFSELAGEQFGIVVHAWMAEGMSAGGAESVLRLLQRLTEPASTRVLVVTSAGCAVDAADQPNPLQAAVSGLVRTARAENPLASVTHVDTSDDVVAAVEAECTIVSDADAVVAYRHGVRWVPRLRTSNEEDTDPLVVEVGGTYLITGGLGAVGYEVATHLQQNYGVQLVLTGRTDLAAADPTDERSVRFDTLSATGPVRYVHCDGTDPAELDNAITAAEQCWRRPLAGVLHLAAAGVEDNWTRPELHLLGAEEPGLLTAALRSKVDSAQLLSELLDRRPSADVILFSSVNGFFGGASFGTYAAASSGLDAVAHSLCRNGTRRVRSIAWSAWDGLGMSRPGASMAAVSQARGFKTLSAPDALLAFDSALAGSDVHVVVGLDASNRFVAPFVVGQFEAASATRTTTFEEPATDAEMAIALVWGDVLEVERVGRDDNFFGLGGTSIAAIKSTAALTDLFGTRVPVSALYENPTVRELALTTGDMV